MGRPEVTIDPGALPRRFVELHLTELSSWDQGRRAYKDIRLHWPMGFDGPSTLRIGYEVMGRGTSSPSIRLTLPTPDGASVLQSYMTAVAAADRAYHERQAKVAGVADASPETLGNQGSATSATLATAE